MVRSNGPNAHLDISVVRSAIDMGHRMIDQIINGVHHGSDEVRGLLCEEIDYVLECKVCRNLFRSFANLVAHKRIYCQETVEEKLEREGAVPVRVEDETVIVEPRAPETHASQRAARAPESNTSQRAARAPESSPNTSLGSTTTTSFPQGKAGGGGGAPGSAASPRKAGADGLAKDPSASPRKAAAGGDQGQGKVRDVTQEVISNKFDGKSVDYQFYTKIAENLEVKKSARVTNTVLMTAIPTNPHAVRVSHAKGDHSGMSHAMGDQSPKSAAQGSPRKAGPVGTSASLSNICMKLASNSSYSATVTDPGSPPGQSKRSRKSTPTKKSKEYIICYPDHTVKKLKSSDDDDMDIDLSLAAILPSENAAKDSEKEWMKKCDIRTKTCKMCGQQCEKLSGLKNHMIHVHAFRIGDHKCPRCEKYYVTVKNVCRHLRTHHGYSEVSIQRFKLNYNQMKAGKLAASKKAVPTQPKQGGDYKPVAQDVKIEKNVSSLLSKKGEALKVEPGRRDWLKHIDVAKKVCKICKAVFEKLGNLKVHMMRVHKFYIGDFKCSRCSRFLSTQHTLKRHLIQVHHLTELQATKMAEKSSNDFAKQRADRKLKKPTAESKSSQPGSKSSKPESKSPQSGSKSESKSSALAESVLYSTLSGRADDLDAKIKQEIKGLADLQKSGADTDPRKSGKEIVTKESSKAVARDSPRPGTKSTPKSVNSQEIRLLSLSKESSKTVIKESPKSTVKESSKPVTKDLAKFIAKDLSKSLSKDSPKSVTTKDLSRSVAKESPRAGPSEVSPSSSSNSGKKQPATRNINFSVKPVKPKSETQNGGTSPGAKTDTKPVAKSPSKLQKGHVSANVSQSNSKEKKQGSSNDKGKIPVRLSRPMKHTKQSVLPLRKLNRGQASSSLFRNRTEPEKTDVDPADQARFEREMKKLQNTAGFVGSSVYSDSDDSGAITLRRRHTEEEAKQNSS